MNCSSPIEARCEVCRVRLPKRHCSSCEALVCEQCLDDWPGWVSVCRTCAEEIAPEARSSDTSPNAWVSTGRFVAIVFVTFAGVILGIAGIARVLDQFLGGAR